jgi:hypothetical protein
MRKAVSIVGFMALGVVATASFAGSWSEYAEMFPLHPCQDGWLGCVVDGETHNSEMMKDSEGYPISSADRVGWHDLKATSVFSPFPRLSMYTGQLEAVADADEDLEDEGPVGVADDLEKPEPNDDAPVASDDTRENPPSFQDEVVENTAPVVVPEEPSQPSTRPVDAVENPTDNAANNPSANPQPKPRVVTETPAVVERAKVLPDNDGVASVTPSEPVVKPVVLEKPQNSILTTKPPTTTSLSDDSCDVLTKLEPKAMLGKLSKGHVTCLEERLGKESKQTGKDKISRILMTNAYASGDRRTWEKLVKRHLDQIDQSDPDICYKYALHLSRKGPGRAKGVIRWAQVALDNRFNWTGNTYKSRVYSLYKLKAQAGQRLWQAASELYNGNPSPDNKGKLEKARNETKVMARAWLDYAREAGKDHTKALQLCVSAAGTEDYCGGG